MPFEPLAWWRARIPQFYQKPTLLGDRGLTGELVERVGFDSLRSRLVDASMGGKPTTWFISGGPATGKSSLCAAMAVELGSSGVPCVILDHQVLETHVSSQVDATTLLRALRPAQVDESKWKSDLKHGRVVIFVDGLNEIRLNYERESSWKVAEQIAFGNHKCPVLSTSRHSESREYWRHLRSVTILELPPMDLEQVDEYVVANDLQMQTVRAEIEDSGLAEVARNPLILSQIVELIKRSPEQMPELPNSRAGVLMRSFSHASDKARLLGKPKASAPVELVPAVATAATLCGLFGHVDTPRSVELRFRLSDLYALLVDAWPAAIEPEWVHIPSEMHFARAPGGPTGEEIELLHQSLLDFGVALLFRHRDPPEFLILDYPEVTQALGNWVGLQRDVDAAASRAIEFAISNFRPDLLVDVAAANEGALSHRAREDLWTKIGTGLRGSRSMRDRTAARLAELSPRLTRIAITNGLLAGLLPDENLAIAVQKLLRQRRFNASSFQRVRREQRWKQRNLRWGSESTSSRPPNRFATLGQSELLDILGSDPKPARRGAAAMALGSLGDRSAVSQLCDVLKDNDASVRGSAATALGALGDRSAVAQLCDALKDADASVRGSTATALGALGDPSAVAQLCVALKDDAAAVRGSAATALGALGDRSAVAQLCDALKDDDATVRGSAATALGALGDPSAIAQLCVALKDDDATVRGSAATALGALGDRSAVAQLCAALKDDGANVRGSAATALGALGDRSAVAQLCVALKDDDANVRGSAATALGALGDRSAVAQLCDALKDDDANVRGSAATALGALGDPNTVAQLCVALRDDDASVRGAAATALGLLGDTAAAEALVPILGDAMGQVRLSAANALGLLVNQASNSDILAALQHAARHSSDPAVRTSAIMALSRVGQIDVPLVRYLIDPLFARKDGRRRDSDWGVQAQTAAAVLRSYAQSAPNAEALDAVASLLRDEDVHRDALLGALAPLDDLTTPALKRALADLGARVPSPPARLAPILDRLRAKVARQELAEHRLGELASGPAKALRDAFPPPPRPWFEGEREQASATRTALLLTAAPIEARTVYQGLEGRGVALSPLAVAGHTCEQGLFAGAGGAWRLVLAQPLEKGPHSMQSLVKDSLPALQPDLVLMVGMCGGIAENGASENSVVVAKQVFNYEPQRVRTEGAGLKPSGYRCDARVVEALNAAMRRSSFEAANETDDTPIEILNKDIGSGEKLIDDLNSPERARIVELSGDLVAVEQEGHGLYHPLWEDSLRNTPPPYALIKGVSDLGDGLMRQNKLERQTRATTRALSVALAIIENIA